MQRELLGAELDEELQRADAAHSEHIEEVVRVQRSLFEIEEKQKVGSLESFMNWTEKGSLVEIVYVVVSGQSLFLFLFFIQYY